MGAGLRSAGLAEDSLKQMAEIDRLVLWDSGVPGRPTGIGRTRLGDLAMQFLKEIKKWLGEITEIALLLVALGVLITILFGQDAPFFSGIAINLSVLLSALGEKGITGLVALGIILFLFYRKKAAA